MQRERERERERDGDRKRHRDRKRASPPTPLPSNEPFHREPIVWATVVGRDALFTVFNCSGDERLRREKAMIIRPQ